MKFVDVLEAKSVYQMGQNVTQFLREKYESDYNTSEIIEIAYDLKLGAILITSTPIAIGLKTMRLS